MSIFDKTSRMGDLRKVGGQFPAAGSANDPKPNDGPQYPAGIGPLGVDLAVLADLSQELRGKVIAALETLADARTKGNKQVEDTAAAALTELIGEIQNQKNAADVGKIFKALRHPNLGRTMGAIR